MGFCRLLGFRTKKESCREDFGIDESRSDSGPALEKFRGKAHVAQLAERVLGKDEVISSTLIMGSIKCKKG